MRSIETGKTQERKSTGRFIAPRKPEEFLSTVTIIQIKDERQCGAGTTSMTTFQNSEPYAFPLTQNEDCLKQEQCFRVPKSPYEKSQRPRFKSAFTAGKEFHSESCILTTLIRSLAVVFMPLTTLLGPANHAIFTRARNIPTSSSSGSNFWCSKNSVIRNLIWSQPSKSRSRINANFVGAFYQDGNSCQENTDEVKPFIKIPV